MLLFLFLAASTRKKGFSSSTCSQNICIEYHNSRENNLKKKVNHAPVEKQLHYKYTDECPIIFKADLKKVKRNDGSLIENAEVVLQMDEQINVSWITLRLSATKNNIFSGIFVKGKSEIRHFGEKEENVFLTVFTFKNGIEKHKIKVQFADGNNSS